MKSMILVALALVATIAAAPVDEPVEIVNSHNEQEPGGGYNFGYQSADGSARQETGQVKQVTDEENNVHDVVVVRGTYEYIGDDGTPVLVSYKADENGYEAEGSIIPKVERR